MGLVERVREVSGGMEYPYVEEEKYMAAPLPVYGEPVKKEKGRPSIHIVLVAPGAEERALKDLWTSHSHWMSFTHTYNPAGDDSEICRMEQYSIGVGKQVIDPFSSDANPATTDDVCTVMAETFLGMSGVGRHMAQAGGYPDLKLASGQQCGWFLFPTGAVPNIGEHGKHVSIGVNQILCTLTDAPTTVRPQVGQPGIHFAFKWPALQAEQADAIFGEHEKFMRATHALAADDATQYYVAKGPVPKNPLAPEEGMTEDLLYNVSMYWASEEGRSAHVGKGAAVYAKLAAMVAASEAVTIDRFDGRMHVNMG